MTNFTIEALIDHPELVETIPLSQISVILSAITNHTGRSTVKGGGSTIPAGSTHSERGIIYDSNGR